MSFLLPESSWTHEDCRKSEYMILFPTAEGCWHPNCGYLSKLMLLLLPVWYLSYLGEGVSLCRSFLRDKVSLLYHKSHKMSFAAISRDCINCASRNVHWRIGILGELCKVQAHPVAHKDDCRVAIPWMMASVAPWQHQWHSTRLFWDMNLGIFRYPKFLGSSLFPKPDSSVSYQTHVSNRHLFSQSCPDAASFVRN